MSAGFGARLRQRREEQGISLVTIAEQTKIKRSLLDALERDDVSHWPEGFFGRAFVRAYARAIGLDADAIVREFLEAHPEPVEVAAAGAAALPGGDGGLRSRVGSALVGSLGRLRRSVPSGLAAPEPLPIEPATIPTRDVDFEEVARLCTAFGRIQTIDELQVRLGEVAKALDAAGLILWMWDKASSELKPTVAHGYSDALIAQLPGVRRETNNPTAAAFRTQQTSAIDATDRVSAALAVPLLTPAGCAGVLAVELQRGADHSASRRAAATIFAAVVAQLIAP